MHRAAAAAVITCALTVLAGPARPAAGDWAPNGVRVPGTANRRAVCVPDSNGGVFVISGPEIASLIAPPQTGVRLHHLDENGVPSASLPDSGVLVWTDGSEIMGVRAWSDRRGGTYVLVSACGPAQPHAVCWETGVLRLLHLDENGGVAAGWPAGGIGFANALADESLEANLEHVDVAVGADGGAAVAWSQYVGPNRTVVAQSFTASGLARWTPDVPFAGRSVYGASVNGVYPRIVSDGADGWIVAATRVTAITDPVGGDVLANHLRGSDGARLWGSAGTPAMIPGDNLRLAAALADGTGGVVLAAEGRHVLSVQRLAATGVRQWGASGTPAGTSPDRAATMTAIALAESNGSAYLGWRDTLGRGRVQRLGTGGPSWTAWPAGRPVLAGMAPALATRRKGGAWLAWGGEDVRLLGLDSTGAVVPGGSEAGIVLGDAGGSPDVTSLLAAGDSLSVCWHDQRTVPGASFAQRLTVAALAAPGKPTSALRFDAVRPNPSHGAWDLDLALPAAGEVRVEVYDLAGRRALPPLRARLAAGTSRLRVDGARTLPPGVYRVRVSAAGASLTRTAVRLP